MRMLIECSHKSDQCMIKSSFLYLGRLRRIHVFTVNHKITVLFACNGSPQQFIIDRLKYCVLIFVNIYFVVFLSNILVINNCCY